MYRSRQIWMVVLTNFQKWKRDPKVWLTFGLGFVICFLLSNKVILFSAEHDTSLQMMESFIWTFGDSKSILIMSLCLLLLFSDMPNLTNEVPFYLVRMNRTTWLIGQVIYIATATFVFVAFVFISTLMLSGNNTYTANMWSMTAAILGYSTIGEKIAIPAFVKVLELSFPYQVTIHIFGLMLGYVLVLAELILVLNLFRSNLGMIAGLIFSGFGLLMNPDTIAKLLKLSYAKQKLANILFGWISPLNHATYYMHNFGYDALPKIWMSYLFFLVAGILLYIIARIKIQNYTFDFTGTEGV